VRPGRNKISHPLWPILFIFSLAACGKEPPPALPPPPPSPPIPAPGPEPELPPLADVKFPEWTEADDEKFLELPSPKTPATLQWDFSPGQRFGYEMSQSLTQRVENRKGGKSGAIQARDRNRGTLEFIAGKDRTALVFIKIHTEEAFRGEVQIPREELEKSPPSKIEAIAKEDGTAEIKKPPDRADAAFYFDTLLALGNGERKMKDGWIRTRAAGFAKVGRYECARLESEFEFSPKAGSGATLQRGRTIAYFALAERRFVRASTAVVTSSRLKALDKDGSWAVALGDSVTRIRVSLLENP
jgi:hypothetical protein